ncbi:uridine kinase [Chlamydia pneumoniae TW-183]|uniref:Uridine kinase n=2 Tax=Chlamydia pneumoniae TaxID=83558 RepID=URK_CHLPN|nr:uridine kinase [Chlamydia pneumoniae]Q9Z7H0.1 RecName: Full=Uridine kinase; AltName: Full=Cytidine monophosphokinase; AltName: Full=Uridine monophosphokinase [Chlamydia pneumoniae]AAD18874.1 Uridine Kinase [Chlamydia pneumoniae CWL029]AAF37907.1 uridine kinase [Chlamydia pneumoniae AR39]AAP98692.1 uridine kinase [Chlamydia pneumoniae TW-183]CRI33256.1 Uridine kinase [Chlamydia pneumoniae]CRI36119.1 Uridine kinase [Chlamydia pneumoniae]
MLMMLMMIIGITGGSGAGKTTLTQNIKEIFGEDVSVICQDNYYKDRSHYTPEERANLIWDHPDAFDNDLLISDIKRLKNNEIVQAPVFDFVLGNRSKTEIETIYPSKVILVEGILVFENQELRDLMDIRIFVDTDADERILRRMVRDVQEQGDSVDCIMSRYLSMVKPMHEKFIEPTRKYADIIVHGNYRQNVVTNILSQKIKNHLENALESDETYYMVNSK